MKGKLFTHSMIQSILFYFTFRSKEFSCFFFILVDDTDRDSASSSAGGNYNKKQMLLKNLDPETSEAAIRDYIRRLSREQATSVKFHFDKTCALIGFRSQIGKNEVKLLNIPVVPRNLDLLQVYSVVYQHQGK